MSSATLIGVDGSAWEISDPSATAALRPGHSLIGRGPVAVDRADNAAGGSTVTGVRSLAAPVRLSLLVAAPAPTDLEELIERLDRALDPALGDCRLVYERDNGERRELGIRYETGLRGAIDDCQSRWMKLDLLFRADDPHWYRPYDSSQQARESLQLNGGGPKAGEATLWNVGSAPCWPVTTILVPTATPGSITIAVANRDTGDIWEWVNPTGGPGDELVSPITIDHAAKTVVETHGKNLYSGLDVVRRTLGPLRPGRNQLVIETHTPSDVRVEWEWTPRWRTC